MYNYPFIRLIRAFLLSLFSEKVTVKDKTTISMRCSIGDIDPYWEMNNGRYQQLADIVRTELSNQEFKKEVEGVKKDIKKVSKGLMAKPKDKEAE